MRKLVLFMAFLVVLSFSGMAQDMPGEIKGGVLNGKAVRLPKPEYPEVARSAGLEGMVEVAVVIDEAGNVISAVASTEPRKVLKTGQSPEDAEMIPAPDPLLRDAAERAALEAKFSPTMLSGVPVRVKGTIVYNFTISKGVARLEELNFDGEHNHQSSSLNPYAIKFPKPKYPPAALAVRAEGAVSVQVTIDETGNVIAATAVSGHPLLRAAAVEAARSATFVSKVVEGKAVQVTGVVTYNFIAPRPEN